MSQNQEGADPYLEYQNILAQDQPNNKDSNLNFTNSELVQNGGEPLLQPVKVHLPSLKEPISLISGNKQDQHFNETIKRSPIGQFLSPQYSRHSQTKSQIRMKILLQNNRLKSNVQVLRKDLDYHRANELKVAQILKESKEKISDFKTSLKEKSKRISEVTQNNVHLRKVINELKDKVQQVTSYSNWQQSQIRELSSKIEQMSRDVICKEKLQQQINNLQNQLKTCQIAFLKHDQNKSNQLSRCSFTGELVSANTLSQRSPQRWGTMNELGMDQVQMFQQRQENMTNNQEYQDLNELNSNLRMRILELQGEQEKMKKLLAQKQRQFQNSLTNHLKKSDDLTEEIQKVNYRSINMQQVIKEKEHYIASLNNQIFLIKEQLNKKLESARHLQQSRQQELEQFKKAIEEKNQKIIELSQRLAEKESVANEEKYNYYLAIHQKEELLSKQEKEVQETVNQLTAKNAFLEKRNEELLVKIEEFEKMQEEYEYIATMGKQSINQMKNLERIVQALKEENEQLKVKLQYQKQTYEENLQNMYLKNTALEDQKNLSLLEIQKYAKEIHQLKIVIQNLNFEQLSPKKEHQRIIQEQEELDSYQQSYSERKEANNEYYNMGNYEGGGPLQEQQPLRESSESSSKLQISDRGNNILKRQKVQEQLSEDYLVLKEKLQQERSAHNISLADINYKLEEEKEINLQLKKKINQMQYQIKQLSTESMENKLSFDLEKDEKNKLKAKLSEIKNQYEERIKKLNNVLTHSGDQLKQKSERIFQLGLELDRMKTQHSQMSHKVINLESSNKKYNNERAILENQLSKMKIEWNNASIQNKAILEQEIEELKSSLKEQQNSKYLQQKQLFYSMQLEQKQKQLQNKNKENLRKLEEKIGQMMNQLQHFREKDEIFKREHQQIQQMRKEIQDFQEKCQILEDLLKQKNNKTQELALKISSLQNNNLNTSQSREMCQVLLKEKEYQITELMKEKEDAMKQLQSKSYQNNNLTIQLQVVKQENQAIKGKIDALQSTINALNKKEQRYKQQFEQKVKLYQNIITHQKDHIQKQYIQKQQLINNSLRVSSEMIQSTTKIKEFESEKELLSKKLDETATIHSKAIAEIERLKQQRQMVKQQKLQLENKLKLVQESIKLKDSKIQQLDLNLANLQSSLEYSRTENSQKLNALRQSLSKENELYLSVKMQEASQTKREIEVLRNQISELKKQQIATLQEYHRFRIEAEKQKEQLIMRDCESCARIQQLQNANFSFGNLLRSKSEELMHVSIVVSQREIVLKEKIQMIDERAQKIGELEQQIQQLNRDFEAFKGNTEKEKQTLNDNLEVRKKMMQQLEDDNQMRVNKLQKEVSNLRSLLNQTERETSDRLQQSTNSINEMQNKLKIQVEVLKQKDQEFKQLKETNDTLKQQNQMLKKCQSRFGQQRAAWEQESQEKEQLLNQLKSQLKRVEFELIKQRKQAEAAKIQAKESFSSKEKAKAQIDECLSKIKQLEMHIEAYRENKVEMERILESSQAQAKKLKEELSQLKKENEISKLQIHTTQGYLKDYVMAKTQMQQMYTSVQLQKEEIFNNLSAKRSEIEEQVRKTQKNLEEERLQKSKVQQLYSQMHEQAQRLSGKILELQKQIIKLQKEKKEIQSQLAKTHEQIVQKSKYQELHLRILQEKQQMSLKLSTVLYQHDQLKQSVSKSNPMLDDLREQNHLLSLMISKLEKQHSTRVESLRSEMRDHGLELQRRHSKQVQDLCEQLSKLRLQRDNLKSESEKAKKGGDNKQQLQKLRSKVGKYEKETKQFENERGELTDKILQLTQENNEFNEIIQTLRNDAMSKGNELFQCKEIIQKLEEQIQQLKQNQPLSSESLQQEKLNQNQLQEDYYQLEAIIYQLQAKNEILQTQINEKIKSQRTLNEKLDQLKVKQTRERNSSCDSWVSRSRIFVDEKSQNMQAQLQDYKYKCESAEAYIQLLQEQIKKTSASELQLRVAELQKELSTKKEEIQNLQAKVQYQNAYIDHLQSDNIKNSVVSKKSSRSKKDEKGFLKVDKDHSVISVIDNSHRTEKPGDIEKLNQKIKTLNDFIENFNKEKDKENLETMRKKLGSAALDQLLSTIIYRLEKEANHFREKQHQNEEITMDNQQLQQELKSILQNHRVLQKKLQSYQHFQSKYEETKFMLQQALMLKVKHEMEISQFKRRIKQLEDSFAQHNTQDTNKTKEDRVLSASMRREKEKDGLSVLHEENQDGSSESMMSENADSQIPSSVSQSKDLRCSLDYKLKNSANIELKKKALSRANSMSNNEKNFTIQFLYKLLDKIDEIDSQVAYIQIELEQKTEKLTDILQQENVQEQIADKLQQIHGIMHENERDIKMHIQKSQNDLTNLFKELIKGISSQKEQGSQNQSRKKIEQYLKLLQSQLYKTKNLQQSKSIDSSRNQSPQTIKLSLHQIKEDILNQDRSSSLVNPKTSRIGHSHSNSEGVQPFENNQFKVNYFQALKELKQTNEDLNNKEESLRKITKKSNLVSQQIGNILDQLLMNFQQNQYFFQQMDKIKQLLFHLTNNDSWDTPLKDPFQRQGQPSKMILIESNTKKISMNDESKSKSNAIVEVAKMSQAKFQQLIQQVTYEDVKAIKRRIEETVQERYNDCLDFLNNQKSLILDILRIDAKRSAEEQAMEKLASRLTKDQIEGIINNSYNKQEARMTLMKIIVEDSKSERISIEDDFSPDIDKMQDIKDRIFPHPTQLSLLLHNQLIKILAAPTRQAYYQLIQQFYNIIRRYQQRINEETSERQSHSEKHSVRIKKLLEQRLQHIDINDSQNLDPLMIRIHKNRSTSCIVNGTESIS